MKRSRCCFCLPRFRCLCYHASLAALLLLALLPRPADAFSSPAPPTRRRRGEGALSARPQTRFREVQGNLLGRRTINDFAPDLPPGWERSLELAIEAATHAPNHKRTEPWRFYLLGPKSIEEVCRLNAELVAATKGEAAGEAKLRRWRAMPGWLVVTCRGKSGADRAMEDPAGLAREDYAACCCAVQNLCLSLNAQAIGTKWTTGPVNFDERFSGAVGFDSNEEFVVGTIWFGAALQSPSPPAKKMGLEDVLTRVE
ncbi:hypothetical protein ACHAWF_016180 [Thalassiosira exigua]